MTPPAIWICPNVDDATVTDLFRDADRYDWLWDLLLRSGGGWKLHDAHTRPNWWGPHTGRPPLLLSYETLDQAGAFAFLRARGIPLAAEMPMIKSWDKAGERCRDQMREAVAALHTAGGKLDTIYGDEPWTWSTGGLYVPGDIFYFGADGKPRYDFVADLVATYDREAKASGVRAVCMTESIPNNPPKRMVKWVKLLKARNALPTAWLWDGVEPGMREAGEKIRALGVPRIEAILAPGAPLHTQADFARTLLDGNDRLHTLTGTTLDGICLESWHCTTDEQHAGLEGKVVLTLPACLPEDDPTSLLAVVRQVARSWGHAV